MKKDRIVINNKIFYGLDAAMDYIDKMPKKGKKETETYINVSSMFDHFRPTKNIPLGEL